jgi:uncharacterized protein (TIGR02466 family)
MNFHQIFPTIIGQINCEISSKILLDINTLVNSDLENHEYYDFIVSKDKNILDRVPNLKSLILDYVHEYAKNALNLNKKIKVTQSWVTKQDEKSSLFPHRHQNSIISGSFYLNINENQSGITFYKDDDFREKYIDWIDTTETNQYNYTNITFFSETGTLILFPSYLKHSVVKNSNNENRLSLAFNTWFDEPIGTWDNLNYLDVQ